MIVCVNTNTLLLTLHPVFTRCAAEAALRRVDRSFHIITQRKSFVLISSPSSPKKTTLDFVCLQPENEEKSVVYDNIGPNVCMGDHKVTTRPHCVCLCHDAVVYLLSNNSLY